MIYDLFSGMNTVFFLNVCAEDEIEVRKNNKWVYVF